MVRRRLAIVALVLGALATACTTDDGIIATTTSISTSEPSTTTTVASVSETTIHVPAETTSDRSPDLFTPLGRTGCDPVSPTLDWFDGDGPEAGLAEARATSDSIEAWGLLWQTPPLTVDQEIKMVWRATGSGEIRIRAISEEGEVIEPTWGPDIHADSNFDRPGDEWGSAFVFPSPGCWEIVIARGNDTAHVWVRATA
jgi:hypothetical protein